MIWKDPKILVVDDSSIVRGEIIKGLKDFGYTQVLESGDGEEALGMVLGAHECNHPFDIVFLDIGLPGKNGLEVLAAIRSNPELKKLWVVMATAEGHKSMIMKAVELGANNYMVKPFNSKTIREKLTRIFEHLQKKMG